MCEIGSFQFFDQERKDERGEGGDETRANHEDGGILRELPFSPEKRDTT